MNNKQQYKHDWYVKNKERILKLRKQYRIDNYEQIIISAKIRRKQNPEKCLLAGINERCFNPNNHAYNRYGGRGIKNYLTAEDIKFLMKRDKYYSLHKPSLDRIDNDGNYCLENCRFIELRENCRKDKKTVRVFQFTLQGQFIQEHISISQASKDINVPATKICAVLKGRRKSAGGFKFATERYINVK